MSIKHINICIIEGGKIMRDPLMTVEEVSMILGISEQTVRKYIRNKEISAIKFKRSYRISDKALNDFIIQRMSV